MKEIDIKGIIEKRGLDTKEIAKQLFPKNIHSKLALNRVIAGEAELNASQISKFSLLSGVPISELFSGAEWKPVGNSTGLVFTNGEYKAELNTQTWVTKIFHKTSIFHDSVILPKTVSMSEYVNTLNELITKYKTNED